MIFDLFPIPSHCYICSCACLAQGNLFVVVVVVVSVSGARSGVHAPTNQMRPGVQVSRISGIP